MEILVCFKTEPEWDSLSHPELDAICQGRWQEQYAVRRWGAHDESALECALRLRDQCLAQGLPAHLSAITVGSCPEKFVTELYAVQFDQVIQIPNPSSDFCPAATAEWIAQYLHTRPPFDLILTGQQVGPGESGMVPLLLADRIELPCVSHVLQVDLTPEGELSVLFKDDSHILQWRIDVPCLCAMEHARYPFLRMARLQQRLQARQARVNLFQAPDASPASEQSPLACYMDEPQGKCEFLGQEAFLQALSAALEEGPTTVL